MSERYVVLGLARPRTTWFTEVGRWATTGSAPVEFVRCVARDELTANLGSGRPYSAVLVDATAHGLDRDLIDLARAAGTATIVVEDSPTGRDWRALGAHGVLPADFSRADLVLALDTHAATLLDPANESIHSTWYLPAGDEPRNDAGTSDHRWISVVGAGSGTSMVAMALAQGLASPAVCGGGPVVLADLALDADQAMLHAAPDIVPGISELVEAFRAGQPTDAAVRDLTFAVDGRGYHLLLGLRRHRDWAALRPRSTAAALDGLAACFPLVVADVDPDLEGETDCGSFDIEERNGLARAAVDRADVVVAVGTADLKGLHALIRLLWRLRSFGVPDERIVPVVNRAPRHPRARAEITRTVRSLGLPAGTEQPGAGSHGALAGTVFLPNVRRLDQTVRDVARLPDPLSRPLATAAMTLLGRLPQRAGDLGVPQPIRPGELGRRFEDRAAS